MASKGILITLISFTLSDPMVEQLKKVVVGIVVPSFCICMFVVIGYVLHHYLTGNGQKSPVNLVRQVSDKLQYIYFTSVLKAKV